MLTHIGARRQGDDLTSLLLECHARIRSFTALAAELAAATRPDPADVADTAARVARYFGEALVLHARDEEESILPRLAGHDRDVDAALVAMHRDHARHGPAVERVVALCRELAEHPERHPAVAPALGAAAAALADHFAGHLTSEEAIVFPALKTYLSAEVQDRVAAELRARRAPPTPAADDHSSR